MTVQHPLLPPSALPGTFPRKREKDRCGLRGRHMGSFSRLRGKVPAGGRGGNKINALREISSGLIPAPPPRANLPSSRAPKRDHDEWLVRWMVGWFGSRAGSGLKYLGMGQFAGQAAAKRTGRPMQGVPGGEAAMHKAAGRGGQCRVARVVRPPMLSAMRHGMLPSPGTISPKPRSAGEARAS